MLHDVFRKGWWTFKIKLRLICLNNFKETFTNESYLYFESLFRKTSCNIRGFGNKFSSLHLVIEAKCFLLILKTYQNWLTTFWNRNDDIGIF